MEADMSHITKIGKFTYWCDECEVYLLSDNTVRWHIDEHRVRLTGIEKYWLEQGDAADRELMKQMGIRWP